MTFSPTTWYLIQLLVGCSVAFGCLGLLEWARRIPVEFEGPYEMPVTMCARKDFLGSNVYLFVGAFPKRHLGRHVPSQKVRIRCLQPGVADVTYGQSVIRVSI